MLLFICDHSSFSSVPFLFLSYWRRRLSAYRRIRPSIAGRSGAEVEAEAGDPEFDEAEEGLDDAVLDGDGVLEVELGVAALGLLGLGVAAATPKPGTLAVCVDAPNPSTRLGVLVSADLAEAPGGERGSPDSPVPTSPPRRRPPP